MRLPWHGGHRRRPCGGAEPGAPRGRLGRAARTGGRAGVAGSRRTAQARGRAGDGVVDELRPARAATTYRPRAWDGQRASRPSSPPSGAEVVPAGTADRGRRAERRRSRFPTSGAARGVHHHPASCARAQGAEGGRFFESVDLAGRRLTGRGRALQRRGGLRPHLGDFCPHLGEAGRELIERDMVAVVGGQTDRVRDGVRLGRRESRRR